MKTHMGSDIRDGMRIDSDERMTIDGGVVISTNLFRPVYEQRHPAIITC